MTSVAEAEVVANVRSDTTGFGEGGATVDGGRPRSKRKRRPPTFITPPIEGEGHRPPCKQIRYVQTPDGQAIRGMWFARPNADFLEQSYSDVVLRDFVGLANSDVVVSAMKNPGRWFDLNTTEALDAEHDRKRAAQHAALAKERSLHTTEGIAAAAYSAIMVFGTLDMPTAMPEPSFEKMVKLTESKTWESLETALCTLHYPFNIVPVTNSFISKGGPMLNLLLAPPAVFLVRLCVTVEGEAGKEIRWHCVMLSTVPETDAPCGKMIDYHGMKTVLVEDRRNPAKAKKAWRTFMQLNPAVKECNFTVTPSDVYQLVRLYTLIEGERGGGARESEVDGTRESEVDGARESEVERVREESRVVVNSNFAASKARKTRD